MAVFEFKNAQELGRVCQDHGVKYLFFGKSGAILLGFSDTTQDVGLYVEMQAANCVKLVGALVELGFRLTEEEQLEIRRGKAFDDAWQRRVEKHGFPIANIDDIVASKQAAKSAEGQGIVAAVIVVPGVVEEEERVRGTRAGRGPAPLNPAVLWPPIRHVA